MKFQTWEPKSNYAKFALDIAYKAISIGFLLMSFGLPVFGIYALSYEENNIILYWVGGVALIGGPATFIYFCMIWLTGSGTTWEGAPDTPWRGSSMVFLGVGRQYFSKRVTYSVVVVATVLYGVGLFLLADRVFKWNLLFQG